MPTISMSPSTASNPRKVRLFARVITSCDIRHPERAESLGEITDMTWYGRRFLGGGAFGGVRLRIRRQSACWPARSKRERPVLGLLTQHLHPAADARRRT